MKRAVCLVFLCLALLLTGLSGCAPSAPVESAPSPTPQAEHYYALVVKDVTNPYMQRMFSGFAEACAAMGARAVLSGPEDASVEEQVACVRSLIHSGVEAIAIASNDRDALSPVLQEALAAGIKVISLDSDVRPEDRLVHIQQASPEVIGRVLMQAAREIAGGEGEYAILTTTASASNQAQWVAWMLRETDENPELYGRMTLVDTLYGGDLYEPSYQLVEELLEEHPAVKIVIAPTVVGLLAAADAIRDAGAPTLVTGLGLPSDMGDYIRDGLCPWMYLWNPIDVGYVAACAADALVRGEIGGEVGEVLSAGDRGVLKVTPAADGGSEIVVGDPYMFDTSNISVWEELF